MSQSTSVAVVARAPAQQNPVATTAPARTSLAAKLFGGSMKGDAPNAVEATKAHNDRVTAQDAADYQETMARLGPPAVRDAAIADAQKLMQTYGTDALRKVVAERGMGSNVHVMDIAARLQRALGAKDAEIADLKQLVAHLRTGRR